MTGNVMERRRHPRVNVVVSIRTIDPTKPEDPQTVSLSESGVLIQADKPFPLGTIVGIELSSAMLTEPMLLKGKVVRTVEGQGLKPYGVGVEFIDPTTKELNRLRRLVKDVSGTGSSVMLVTEDDRLLDMLRAVLIDNRYHVVVARGYRDVHDAAKDRSVEVVVGDLAEPGREIRLLRSAAGECPVVVICKDATAEVKTAAAALGIYEILEKPVNPERLLAVVSREIQAVRLKGRNAESDNAAVLEQLGFVARSKQMQELVKKLLSLARAQRHVLILGETGVGKMMMAQALHAASARRGRPLVVADCAKMEPAFMISDIFGHEKGSYTGAISMRKGFVEQATDGVLFLDEIGELSLEGQAKLLRLLDEGTYRRLGGDKDLKSKGWILAATNRDLRSMVQEGRFREDLYYRLHVHTINVPPLRERVDDLVPLVHHFLVQFNPQYGKHVTSLGSDALNQLISYTWPGNVRELRNVIEASLLEAEGPTLSSLKIRTDLAPVSAAEKDKAALGGLGALISEDTLSQPWKKFRQKTLDGLEKAYLQNLLKRFEGNITAAASHARMTRQSLTKKIRRHKIRRADFLKWT